MLVQWLHRHWVASALGMGLLLLVLTPLLSARWDSYLLLVYLQTPAYMFHQVEEHTGDRFRHFVNHRAFGGVEALSTAAVLWINIPGVWGVTLASLYCAAFLSPGWGLPAAYLVLVNAAVHVIGAAASRTYNPGLWTSIVLFLPAAAATLWQATRVAEITSLHHWTAFGIAFAIHAGIVLYARTRAKSLLALQARA